MENKEANLGTKSSYHSFLMSLKGKMVTIYRGGPESRTGILLDVQSDYIAILSQKNNNDNNQNNNQNNNQSKVIYYQAEHVKSISENSKSNSMQLMQSYGEQVDFLQAENFLGLLKEFGNKTIQINQGGPESKYGTLLSVQGDHLILFTEDDGVVYVNAYHVKSICEYQNNNNFQLNNAVQSGIVYPDYVNVENFQNVFRDFSHQWVSINRGGPEAMEGVLVENAGGHYTLVNNEEVLRIHPYHIKSISVGPKGSLKQNKQNDNNQQDQSNNQNNNANNSNSDGDKKQSEIKSNRSRSRSRNNDKVVKTIDYVWNSKE
ncbi:spore coat protein B [Oikeobacillus pervagus]|uniref:Spore coat protein B n=1 Tax=Oikeobacillus pervagus TaxID=1325931 RepID=A0AAJ1T8M7_9BACI|nr:spore coat protein [Oikeobacillus pervagus]MDQ0216635.1 spore coat protein B [Oikeobacillus pervagus]